VETKLKKSESAQAAAAGEAEALREQLRRAREEGGAAAEEVREALQVKLLDLECARKAAARQAEALRDELRRAREEAKAAAEAARKALQLKLLKSECAREAAARQAEILRDDLRRARQQAEAEAEKARSGLEAKLQEAMSARSAASWEANRLREELRLAREEARTAAEEARTALEAKLQASEAARLASAKDMDALRRRLEAAENRGGATARSHAEPVHRAERGDVAQAFKDRLAEVLAGYGSGSPEKQTSDAGEPRGKAHAPSAPARRKPQHREPVRLGEGLGTPRGGRQFAPDAGEPVHDGTQAGQSAAPADLPVQGFPSTGAPPPVLSLSKGGGLSRQACRRRPACLRGRGRCPRAGGEA
jgi:hypothetical protein